MLKAHRSGEHSVESGVIPGDAVTFWRFWLVYCVVLVVLYSCVKAYQNPIGTYWEASLAGRKIQSFWVHAEVQLKWNCVFCLLQHAYLFWESCFLSCAFLWEKKSETKKEKFIFFRFPLGISPWMENLFPSSQSKGFILNHICVKQERQSSAIGRPNQHSLGKNAPLM